MFNYRQLLTCFFLNSLSDGKIDEPAEKKKKNSTYTFNFNNW